MENKSQIKSIRIDLGQTTFHFVLVYSSFFLQFGGGPYITPFNAAESRLHSLIFTLGNAL